MFRFVWLFCLVVFGSSTLIGTEPAINSVGHWPQGTGPASSFAVSAPDVPRKWSVVRNQNIRWRKTLSETGQSTVVVWGDRIFFSTLEDVDHDSDLGQNIVAYCCDSATGKTLWTRTIAADHPLRLSGCFSDSSAPPPVTDGERVCFFNASGTISVMGDKRSQGNGWGHHASAVPTVAADHLFIPTMSGTVYVIDHDADVLDEKAVVAINDLGSIGTSWNRASLSFSADGIFAHTIREVICIGE